MIGFLRSTRTRKPPAEKPIAPEGLGLIPTVKATEPLIQLVGDPDSGQINVSKVARIAALPKGQESGVLK